MVLKYETPKKLDFCLDYLVIVLALNLKEIPYEIKPVSLIKAGGEQHSNEYRELNPMEQVPALHIDAVTLVESLNIMQYLEETRLHRPLLPSDVVKRAKVGSRASEVLTSQKATAIVFQLLPGARNMRSDCLRYPTSTKPVRVDPCGRGEEG